MSFFLVCFSPLMKLSSQQAGEAYHYADLTAQLLQRSALGKSH